MTIAHAIKRSSLDRLDAELLLARVLKKDRAWLMAHRENPLPHAEEIEFASFVERRKRHEPIAYILGEKEFYGRAFQVDQRVLIPRPSTETLIDEVKLLFDCKFHVGSSRIRDADSGIVVMTHLFSDRLRHLRIYAFPHFRIVDIGAGSGCIAITLALEIPNIQILATDISNDALTVARENAIRHNVSDRIIFSRADLLNDDKQNIGSAHLDLINPTNLTNLTNFLLVSNPPYIPIGEPLAQDIADYEPREALFSGLDGMDMIRRIVREAARNQNCLGFVMEMREEQAHILDQDQNVWRK